MAQRGRPAKSTQAKTTTTKATPVKETVKEVEVFKEDKVVEEVKPAPAKEVVVKSEVLKVESKQVEKTSYSDEDFIDVFCLRGGRVNYDNSEKPYDAYTWEGFGSYQPVRFGTMMQARRRGTELFKILYIPCPHAQKQLNIVKEYESFGVLADYEKLFDQPIGDIMKFIDKCDNDSKTVVSEILFREKDKLSFAKVKAVSEKLGLSIDIDL